MGILLFISVLLIAACGLIYELIAGTLASYLLGDSVLQFSTIIGCYLFAMGIGSALSRYIHRGLAFRFVWIELMLGVVGGFSSALLFLAFAYTQGFQLLLYALVVMIGVLVGLEIPLLMRMVRERYHFRDVVAHVLTFDYLGALGASLLFPLLLVPTAGTGPLRDAVRTDQRWRGAVEHVSFREAVTLDSSAAGAVPGGDRVPLALGSPRRNASRRLPKTIFMRTKLSLLAIPATSTLY